MTSPRPHSIDPRLVAQLSTDFTALGQQLGEVGRGLSALRLQLETVPAQPVQQFQPPVYQPPLQPQYRPQPMPVPNMPPPHQPPPIAARPAPEPREPWWQRDGVISRLLAVAGAGVTLIGVVMLLVLAAQAGIFGPQARVVAGAVFSGALVFAGTRVFGRPGGRVGGIALAATGIAGGYLTVLAVTSIYGWLEAPLGLGIALGVTAAGVALAAKWESQSLALMVVAGVAVLAPVMTDGLTLTLVAFLLVLQIACFPAQLVRNWPYLHAARTVPVVLALMGAIAGSAIGSSADDYRLLAAAAIVAAVGIGTTVVAVWKSADDVVASVSLAIATVPLLLSAAMFERTTVAIVQGVLAAALLGVAAYRGLPSHTRVAALAPAAVALLQTCIFVTQRDTLPIALLVVAAAFVACSEPMRSKVVYLIGAAFAVLGGLTYLEVVRPEALAASATGAQELGASTLVSSLLVVGVLVLLIRQAQRLGIGQQNAQLGALVAGAAGLYAVTAATVAAGVAAGGASGFTAGHTVATIAWMLVATALLLRGLRIATNAHAMLFAGLGLTAAALAKLFLFDLATLDGLLRVAAFIAVGVLLLVAGTRYARAFADRDEQSEPKVTAASAG